ncbi:MAG: hypothetical protein A2169_11850 [Deltaproteobacteria bacterium RBG_13_47_9]|nr:MAG: hypothetical protein A2169_11850 [Deltaproteobacteria bacterium RBG_13_47_9]
MIRTHQKCPNALGQNTDTTLHRRRATFQGLIKPFLRFVKNLQRQSHEVFIKRILEERVALHESQSKAIIARRPEIHEEPLVLRRRKKEIPMRDKPILIVDDEKNVQLVISQALEALGVRTEIASDGKEALAKLKDKEYGLILLDLHMPGVDGMEVLRHVHESRSNIRVIIITAYGTVKLAMEAIKLGAVDFMHKPFLPEEIRARVAQVIDRENNRYVKGERSCTFD